MRSSTGGASSTIPKEKSMKRNFLKIIACALCMAVACVTLGSCGGSKLKDWLDDLVGNDSSSISGVTSDDSSDTSSDAPDDSSTEKPDDSSSSDAPDDSSTEKPDDSSSSEVPDEPDEPDEPIYNDFAYFDGEVLGSYEDENVSLPHEKIVCSVGEQFRLRMEGGEVEEIIPIGTSDGIVTCDKRGNVTTLSPGIADYFFKIGGQHYSTKIIVAEKENATDFAYFDGEGEYLLESDIYVNPVKAGVKIGDTFRVKAVEASGKPLSIQTFGNSVGISVDERGNVTAISEGVGRFSIKGASQTHLVEITVYGDEHVHTETAIADVAATCTKEGSKGGVKCADCGEVLTAPTTVPATGHTAVTDAAVAATCTKAGKTEGKHCSVCNAVIQAQTTVPATGHTAVTDAAVAATCTTPGKTEGKHCSVCNAVIQAQTTVPATGHTEVIDAFLAATCTTPGKTEGKHCAVCNAVLQEQQTIPATGHTEVTDAAVAATCTTPGKTEGKHCAVCNVVIQAQTTVPATGHTEVTDAAVAATCTTPGKTEGKHCSVCNAVLQEQQTVPATGHTEVINAMEYGATCTTAGQTKGSYCGVCKEVLFVSEKIPAFGHSDKDSNDLCDVCGIANNSEVIPTEGECVLGKTYRIYAAEDHDGGDTYTCQAELMLNVTGTDGIQKILYVTVCGERFGSINQSGFAFESTSGDGYRDITFKAGTYTAVDFVGREVTFYINETSVIDWFSVNDDNSNCGYVRRIEKF